MRITRQRKRRERTLNTSRGRERWASSLYAPKETYISGPVTLHFDVISSRRCCCCCCSSVWQVAWQLCEGRRRSFFCCFAFVSFYDWPRTNVNWIYILISDILILSDRSSRRACESSASNYTALYIHISLLIGVYIMSYLFVFIGAMEFLVRVPFPLRRFRTTYIYLIYSSLSFVFCCGTKIKTGSCELRTCWKAMPSFREVSLAIYSKFNISHSSWRLPFVRWDVDLTWGRVASNERRQPPTSSTWLGIN